MIRQVAAIVWKDLLLERRGKANLNALAFLGVLLLVILSFALGPSPSRLHAAAGGVLWVAFAFAGVLAFSRAYQVEMENRCFEAMLLAGADPKAIYLGKLLGTVAVMLVVEIAVGVVLILLYAVPPGIGLIALCGLAFLGTVGFASVGVLYGRLTMNLRAREIMLPLLVLPIVIPALLASVKASSMVLGQESGDLRVWVELLVAFDVVFLTAGFLSYEALAEE